MAVILNWILAACSLFVAIVWIAFLRRQHLAAMKQVEREHVFNMECMFVSDAASRAELGLPATRYDRQRAETRLKLKYLTDGEFGEELIRARELWRFV